jgi:hypothetical protein
MNYLKSPFLFFFIASFISCGGKNESEETIKNETNIIETSKIVTGSTETELANIPDTVKLTDKNYRTKRTLVNNAKNSGKNSIESTYEEKILSSAAKEADAVINSPLRNLLNTAQIGKSYSQKELIEEYKFPKEGVNLIKQVTFLGHNKVYFKWGNTWIAEKVSDAKFKNDTLIFVFKQNKTYLSGGAIGIKHNKKIHTDLLIINGNAYITSVKGYHWEIGKK